MDDYCIRGTIDDYSDIQQSYTIRCVSVIINVQTDRACAVSDSFLHEHISVRS